MNRRLKGCIVVLGMSLVVAMLSSACGGGAGNSAIVPTGPAVSLSVASLTFGSQNVGTSSSPQAVTLSNTGNASLSVTSISISGPDASDFSESKTCGASVAAGANCTITVTFTPSTTGSLSASVTIVDAVGTQTVALSGTGASPFQVSLAPSALNFGIVTVGTTSSSQTITLTDTGTAAVTITSISIAGANSGDFAQTNNCGSSVAVGANCAFSVTFTPSTAVNETASLIVVDSAGTQIAGLEGGPLPPITAAFFGMSIHVTTQWPTVHFGSVGHQPDIGWMPREPSNGNFVFGGDDLWVSAELAHGNSGFIYDLGGDTPAWAGPSSCSNPTNISDWDNYVTTLATHYKGEIENYEIMNEANRNTIWCGTTAQLVTLAQHAYNDIKAIDPTAQVLTPSTAAGSSPDQWLAAYLAAGGNLYADVGTFHGYMGNTNVNPPPYPDQATTSGPTGYCQGSPTPANCTGSIIQKYTNIRNAMDQNGMSGKPIYDDEGSWGLVNSLENLVGTTDANTAVTNTTIPVAWMARYYLLQANLGVARVDWYQWGTTDPSNSAADWGNLLDTSGNVTPAGTAYGVIYNWLVGATPTGACATLASNPDTYTCGYTRPGGYQAIAVWNTSGASGTFTPGSPYAQYRDISDQVHTIPSGGVPIGLVPVLVETLPSPVP